MDEYNAELLSTEVMVKDGAHEDREYASIHQVSRVVYDRGEKGTWYVSIGFTPVVSEGPVD